jgi:cell division protein FtsW (lipid II flippase)
MPRIQSPIRNRPIVVPKQETIQEPKQETIQRKTFNYKQILTCLIAVAIMVYSVLFCGIQDTLRYLEFIIVLFGVLVITLVSIMKSDDNK